MITRLQVIGNSYGLIIDELILELLQITATPSWRSRGMASAYS